MRKRSARGVAAATVASASLIAANSGPVAAADQPSSPGAQIEEVVVTARRIEENVQRVPIAITVVSQQKLEQNNIQTLGDLQYLVPSMSSGAVYTRDSPNVFIRGQGVGSLGSQPGVVAYLNEVPLPVDNLGDLAGGPGLFFDLQNVQVLKGPQGTLFGRNSEGGALLLQTARPTNDFGGNLQLGYGNYNDQQIDGVINVPIIDGTLLARLAFDGEKRDGFTRLLGEPSHPGGIDADNRDYGSVRGTVTFRPNQWFQNDTIVTYSQFNSNGNPFFLTAVNPTGTAAKLFPSISTLYAQEQALGPRTALAINNDDESDGHNLSLNNITSMELADNLKIRNIFGYDASEITFQLDNDSTPLNIAGAPYYPAYQPSHQYTEELQLVGQSFNQRLDWIVGAFYLDKPKDDYFRNSTFLFNGLSDTDSLSAFGSESQAIFGQATYDLSDVVSGLKLTGGIRYTWDDVYNTTIGAKPGTSGAFCGTPAINCSYITALEEKSSAPTYTLGLDYQATEGTLLYFTTRRGYKAGGTSGLNSLGQALPNYGPEYVTDYEVGAKSDGSIAGRPFRSDLDVYYEDYTGIQVNQQTFVNNVLSNIGANAASGRVWGTELETLLQLTDDLAIGANFDYLNFKYTSFEAGVSPATVIGTRTLNRPPYKYGINASYHLPIASELGDVVVRANWSWQDVSNDPLLPPGGKIDAFGILNLSADWNAINGGPIDASFFMTNALDKVYSIGGFAYYNSLGFSIQRYGEPRMFGFRLRYHFS